MPRIITKISLNRTVEASAANTLTTNKVELGSNFNPVKHRAYLKWVEVDGVIASLDANGATLFTMLSENDPSSVYLSEANYIKATYLEMYRGGTGIYHGQCMPRFTEYANPPELPIDRDTGKVTFYESINGGSNSSAKQKAYFRGEIIVVEV